MVAKIGLSFQAYLTAKMGSVLSSIITTTGAATHGISGYVSNGFSDNSWLTIARNVKLANGGADVYALGTQIALRNVLPDSGASTSLFRYGEDSSIIKTGFLPSYKGVSLIEMDNALVPNTINSTPLAVLPDNVIYMVPMGMNKPLKVVYEGGSVSVEKDPMYAADHCYGFTVDMRIGMDAIVGSKFGALVL